MRETVFVQEIGYDVGGDGKPRSGYSMVESLNWYSYVSNNPVKYVDPSGMYHIKAVVDLNRAEKALLARGSSSSGSSSSGSDSGSTSEDPDPAADNPVIFGSPVLEGRLTSGFNEEIIIDGTPYEHKKGIDLAKEAGTPIRAVAHGIVRSVGHQKGKAGNYITFYHDYGYVSKYFHLEDGSTDGFEVGDEVNRGDQIGTMGETGNTTGPHLHLELYKDGKVVNPYEHIFPLPNRNP